MIFVQLFYATLYFTTCLAGMFRRQASECPLVKDPVCGTDGQTYPNECMANSHGVDVAHDGACIEEFNPAGGPATGCRFSKKHVCGVDGKTYQNDCVAQHYGVGVAYGGACILQKLAGRGVGGSRCHCTKDRNPVCGVDGKTYSNMCVASCAGVQVQFEGACQEQVVGGIPKWRQPGGSSMSGRVIGGGSCACTKEYSPVCGSDGKTYPNSCRADCAGVDVIATGPCNEMHRKGVQMPETPEAPSCACPKIKREVCGSDGQTYPNSCVATCNGVSYFPGQC